MEIIRSSRRTIAIEVKRDLTVIVRAPWRASQAVIERFVSEKQEWIQDAVARQRDKKGVSLSKEQIDLLRSRAKAELKDRVEFYSKVMGVEPAGMKITSAKARYGSCSSTNRLCFSLFLMLSPQNAIDYVVVHELAHIVYHNHGKQFYALIESIFPDYKQRKKALVPIPY